MTPNIRFQELVKQSGKPETMALWKKPADGDPFLRAVKENRVLTVFQKPSGTHKDFGKIGFHQEPFSLYLVFPNPLPKALEARIIGVKYDLIEEPKAKDPVKSKPPLRLIEKPERSKIMFEVQVERIAVIKSKLSIFAADKKEAKSLAEQELQQMEFEASQADFHNKIKAIHEYETK